MVYRPCRYRPLRSPMGALPPCILHLPFRIAGPRQGKPDRQRAPHRRACRASSKPCVKGHAPVEAAILDHDVGRDMAFSLDLFPRQPGGRVAYQAGLLRRVLQPVAGSAVLQDEPLFD
jgi:hypothetical protein